MPLLTAQQIEELREIIRDASTAVAVTTTGMEVSPETMAKLVEGGYIREEDIRDLSLDAFELGRLLEKLPGMTQMSFPEFKGYLEKNPIEMSDAERRAYSVARDRAGQFCVGLGTRFSGEVGTEVIKLDEAMAERFRQGIQDETAYKIVRRDAVGNLTTKLRQMSEDWARDWGRIASTESQMAYQQGFFEATVRRHGTEEMLAKMPEPTACPDCRRLYLDTDGKPEAHPASWWAANGVNNVGRKRAEWMPVLGSMHPWCQCQLVRVPRGMVFDDQWDIVPESMVEDAEKSLSKAEQLAFGGGWSVAPRSKKGAQRRKRGAGWEYRYPGEAAPSGGRPELADAMPGNVEPYATGRSWPVIGQTIKSTEDAAQVLREIADSDREKMLVLTVDAQGHPMNVHCAHVGLFTGVQVHPMQIFKPALMLKGAGIYLAHNHPSGNAEPSGADHDVTARMERVGKVIGIPLLGHVVLVRGQATGKVVYSQVGTDAGGALEEEPATGAVPEVEFRLHRAGGLGAPIVSSDGASRWLEAHGLKGKTAALMLDAKNKIIATQIGRFTQVEIFRRAVKHGAVGVITVGGIGEAQPVTKGELDDMGLTLLDHVTLEGDGWRSAADLGVLKSSQLGLFGSPKPSGGGWQLIPAGRHGGYRRRKGAEWEYWYPEMSVSHAKPETRETEEVEDEEVGGDVRRSKKFKRWFGDWEQGQGSRVVKRDGSPAEQWGAEPIVVYHGTAVGGFSSFDPAHDKGQNLYGRGFYFTASKVVAKTYLDKNDADRAGSVKGLRLDGKPVDYLPATHAELIEHTIIAEARRVSDPEHGRTRPFVRYDSNTLWALHAAADKDGRVNVEKFLAEWWHPSDKVAAQKIADDAARGIGPEIRSEPIIENVEDPQHAGLMLSMFGRVERDLGHTLQPVIPDPELFECYLNIRKPIDMDAEPTDDQLESLGKWWEAEDAKEIRREIEEAKRDGQDEQVKKKQAELGRRGKAGVGLVYANRVLSMVGLGMEHTWDRSGPRDWVKMSRRSLEALKRRVLDDTPHGMVTKALNVSPRNKLTWGDVYCLISDGFRERSAQSRFREWGQDQGHDGVRHTGGWNLGEREHEVWIAWHPTQIKATTAKEFSPTSTDIRKSHKLHYRTVFAGLPISVENRKGSIRRWYDRATETEGETKMQAPYGYIRMTEGADGDHLDVYLGPDETAKFAYVVHQRRPPTFDAWDEDKIMIGYPDLAEAKAAYLAHYDDPRFFGSVTAIPIGKFRQNVLDGKYRKGEMVKARGFHKHPIGTSGGVSLYEVDGEAVRASGRRAFTNYAHHWSPELRGLVPEDEGWLDRENAPDERRFLLDGLLRERSMMSRGCSYDKALEAADRVMRRERAKSSKGRDTAKLAPEEWLDRIELKVLGHVGDLRVVLADGDLIRDRSGEENWTEGGHDLVYRWGRAKTVYLDNDLKPGERPIVIRHEVTERGLMAHGMSYEQAHRRALIAEAREGGLKLEKAKPVYVGPRGGRWEDPQHTRAWKPEDPETLHARFGGGGAPAEGERGHRDAPKRPAGAWDGEDPDVLATDMVEAARKVWTDSDYGYVARLEPGEEWEGFTREDLPDLLHVPYKDGQGKPYSERSRADIADRLIEIAAETDPAAAAGDVGIELPAQQQRHGEVPDWSPEGFREGMAIPTWVAAAILADSMDRDNRKMRLVNVSKTEAARFISEHHSTLPYLNPRGLMYAIGVKRGSRLVAVATAGHPTGRALRGTDPRNTVELTRVASDGTTKNAASMLTSRVLDLLERSKRGDPKSAALFITYQLAGEPGDTYRALKDKGLRPVEFIRGERPHGSRSGSGERSLATVDKIRWEAGPAAGPADWSLLEDAEQMELFKAQRELPGIPSGKPPAGWMPIEHPRGGRRGYYKLEGGKRVYLYPEFQSGRQVGQVGEQVASTVEVFVNVSAGAEHKRFVEQNLGEFEWLRERLGQLGRRGVGVQVTAHDVLHARKTTAALDRWRDAFARQAQIQGLKMMVDSGEFGRFRADGPPIDFDQVFSAYEAMASRMPPGTLQVVAPDKIGDAKATAELRERYADRARALIAKGVDVIVPIQARDARGIVADYMRVRRAFGDEGVIIAFPTAAKTLPMSTILPALIAIYRQGRSPKVHFLGLGDPKETAGRTVQIVAAHYFASRKGLPLARVAQLTRTPSDAQKALDRVKAWNELSLLTVEPSFERRVRSWAVKHEKLTPEQARNPLWGVTTREEGETLGRVRGEAWQAFLEAHPEEFDQTLISLSHHWRRMATRLVQGDTRAVSSVQQYGRRHDPVTGTQVTASRETSTVYPKPEHFPEVLDEYLVSREMQTEGAVSGKDEPWGELERLRPVEKADVLVVGDVLRPPVGTMGNFGNPARTPGQAAFAAPLAPDHPASLEQRKKRGKRKRDKRADEKRARMVELTNTYTNEAHPVVINQMPRDRQTEENREVYEAEAERRGKRLAAGRLTLGPKELRGQQ